MNQKHLEIFLKYRKRRYEREFEDLQNDLALRGLIHSTEREVREARLKADYEDEVDMKKEEVTVQEEERVDQREERENASRANRATIKVAIVSIISSVLIALLTSSMGWYHFRLSVRPFLVTLSTINAGYAAGGPAAWGDLLEKNPNVIKARFFLNTEPDGRTTSTLADLSFALKNVGKTPLKYRLESISYIGGEWITEIPNQGNVASRGIIPPDQTQNVHYMSQDSTQLLQNRNGYALTGLLVRIRVGYEPIGEESWIMFASKYFVEFEAMLSCNQESRECFASTWHIRDAN